MALPPTIRWTDPNPPPPLNPQDQVTILVRDTSLAEPADMESCVAGGYFCLSHRRPYHYGACGDGPHEIRWECGAHRPEGYGVDQQMVWNPSGFDPPLTPEQIKELDA